MASQRKLDHLGIVVKDLDEARRFWEQALGLTCTHVEEMPQRGIKVAFLPVGDTRIELIAPLHERSEVSRFLETRGPGLHHVALRTGDVAADITQLTNEGIRLVDLEPKPGAHNTQVAFVHPKSTGGVLVELAQLPDEKKRN